MLIGEEEKTHSKYSENLRHSVFIILFPYKYSNKFVTIRRFLETFHTNLQIHFREGQIFNAYKNARNIVDYSGRSKAVPVTPVAIPV
jgi:hypothetical protein